MDNTKTLIKSAKSFFSGTLISRITGFGRDVAMASAFGTNPMIAAFFVAFRLAHLFRRILGEGALQSAFIPHFENLKIENSQKASKFFTDLYTSVAILLVLIIAIGCSLIAYLLQTDISEGNLAILQFTQLMLPSLLFICLFGINASLLQCEKHYFLPSIAPVAFNLIWIAAVLFVEHSGVNYDLKLALMFLSIAITAACFGQWLMTAPKSFTIIRNLSASNFFFKKICPFSKEVRTLASPLLLAVVGIAATQINSALDLFFARTVDLEGPAYLWFAIRIEQLPLALFGIALSSALLPPLSRALKENNTDKYLELLHYALEQASGIMLPMTAALMFLGHSGVLALYGFGNFNLTSISQTTLCLYGYALGLIPQALVLLMAPAFHAQKDYATPAIAAFVSIFLNIALNALFIYVYHFGTFSIAIATSLAAWANLCYLTAALKFTTINSTQASLRTSPVQEIWKSISSGIAYSAPGTLIAAVATYQVDSYVNIQSSLIKLFIVSIPFLCYFTWFHIVPLIKKGFPKSHQITT